MSSKLRLPVICALALAGFALPALAAAPATPPGKPSSFAPHPGGQRVYGAPIQSPILHSRKKHAARGKTAKHGRHRSAAARPVK